VIGIKVTTEKLGTALGDIGGFSITVYSKGFK
jgi:hypothetical protein